MLQEPISGASGTSGVEVDGGEGHSDQTRPQKSENKSLRRDFLHALHSQKSFQTDGNGKVTLRKRAISLPLDELLDLTLTSKSVPAESIQGLKTFLKFLVSQGLDSFIKNEHACEHFNWYEI